MEVSQKTENRRTICLAVPLLGIYLDKTLIQNDTCTPMFLAALFTIAKSWKQPQYPLTDEWRKMWWVKCESCSVMSDSLWPHGLYIVHGIPQTRILAWVAVPFSRRSSQCRDRTQILSHCRWILYHLSHQGSPRLLEWVAYPFSSRFSWPRNWTGSPALQADSLPTELWSSHMWLHGH